VHHDRGLVSSDTEAAAALRDRPPGLPAASLAGGVVSMAVTRESPKSPAHDDDDDFFVPKLVAGYDPKWRPPPVTRVLLPTSPPKWSPTSIVAGRCYVTGEFCDDRPGRPIVVKAVGYAYAKGRWECVVVSSGRVEKRRAGDRVYRLARDLKPRETRKKQPESLI
jgi:hypothetical protein